MRQWQGRGERQGESSAQIRTEFFRFGSRKRISGEFRTEAKTTFPPFIYAGETKVCEPMRNGSVRVQLPPPPPFFSVSGHRSSSRQFPESSISQFQFLG